LSRLTTVPIAIGNTEKIADKSIKLAALDNQLLLYLPSVTSKLLGYDALILTILFENTENFSVISVV